MDPTPTLSQITRRQDAPAPSGSCPFSTGDKQLDSFLCLISNPFQETITTSAFLSSLALSLGLAAVVTAVFCFIRPLNNVVYAPRAKYADEKHAPPKMGKAPLSWIKPVLGTKEQQLVDTIGLDAALFIRFAKMCRNIFTILTIIGCGVLIPVNIIAGRNNASSWGGLNFLNRLTPQYLYGSQAFWAYVVLAYIFDFVICFFLWTNYRAVVRLRKAYFLSSDFQNSLHARTLLVTEVPKTLRSDEALVNLVDSVESTEDVPRTAIARNVKDLPELVEEHEDTVKELEQVLAKYLKNPDNLPAKRPTTKAHKTDNAYKKGQSVDAIDYLTSRIKELEIEIKEVRESVDKRNALPYGFASYALISDAHNVAFKARKGGPKKTEIRLAPRPNDLIWKNLPMSRTDRFWANFYNNIWVAVLTIIWIVPNVLSAVFLSQLYHIGILWPAFNRSLQAHPGWWGVVQGIAAPAITNLFYFFLPAIFRKLSVKSGDVSKTSRERHVMHKLFSFFVFNNLLVYSLFSAVFGYVVAVVGAKERGESAYDAIKDGDLFTLGMNSLENMSTYWLTWLLQRNLGAAIDLAQLFTLVWGSFSRRFLSPTPRQVIELSAPQPFDYAGYYNYFLFYAIVTLSYATLQPLVLPVTALYFWLDTHAKTYLLMYVFITKYESGGKFWRVLFNRMIFSALFGNAVIALVVVSQGSYNWAMLGCLGPLPFLLLGFKWYCNHTFDNQINYYTKAIHVDKESAMTEGEVKTKRHDRVAVRFGHPVLYKPLITPMVHKKAQHMLSVIYSGRTSGDYDNQRAAGYSDVYMDSMNHNQPGKKENNAPFELVDESQLDFQHFMNRPEFRDQAGGDGELYGRAPDQLRRGSGQSGMTSMTNLTGFQGQSRSRSESRESERTHVEGGTTYPSGYHKASALRDQSPAGSMRSLDIGPERGRSVDSMGNLVSNAARMGRSPPPAPTPGGYGPIGGAFGGMAEHGMTPPAAESPGEDTSYEYFRRGRQLG
ncbi:hypothetical protein MBLNU457_5225t2 [Dothideomycetes sp. NU457]